MFERSKAWENMTAEPSESVQRARFELQTALTEIEFRLNLPERIRRSAERVRSQVVRLRDERPFVFTELALGLALAIAAAVWGALRLIRK